MQQAVLDVNKFVVNVIIKIIIVLICGTIAFLCVYNDYSLYSKTIGKIILVETSGEKQQIEVEIKNGEKQGAVINIESHFDKSLVYDQKYHKGDVVFLDSDLKMITGVKRDHWVAAAVALLLGMLLGFGSRKGLFTSVCFHDVAVCQGCGYSAYDGHRLSAVCFHTLVSGQRHKQSYRNIFYGNDWIACCCRGAVSCVDLEYLSYGV